MIEHKLEQNKQRTPRFKIGDKVKIVELHSNATLTEKQHNFINSLLGKSTTVLAYQPYKETFVYLLDLGVEGKFLGWEESELRRADSNMSTFLQTIKKN